MGGALSDLSLEELLATSVTSLAKRPQSVESSPAAVFIVSREDIRRAGVLSLPEALRMVPGLDVAVTRRGGFTVSSRGFNGPYANKLLVLVDGQTLNLSTVSGGVWDQQLTPLETIERIEIVRGPGAAAWGGNALNGVVNIITRHPVDTLGLASSIRTDGEQYALELSGGAQLGQGVVRAYVTERRLSDQIRGRQAGLRYDADLASGVALTLAGDVQTGRFETLAPAAAFRFSPGSYSGGGVLGRLVRTGEDGDSWTLQGVWREDRRTELGALRRRHAEINLARYARYGRHALTWGAEFREETDDGVEGGQGLAPLPASQERRYGLYAQDDISLSSALTITVGAKIEHNSVTGVEVQPTARASLSTGAGWFWLAASKATRPPSRFEAAGSSAPPGAATGLKAETVTAYEAGWRAAILPRTTFDLAAYHNTYADLIATGISTSGLDQDGATLASANAGKAEGHGLEAAIDVRASDRLTLKTALAVQTLKTRPAGGAVVNLPTARGDAATQVSLRAQRQIGPNLELDAWLRHAETVGAPDGARYTDLDLRLGWRPTDQIELSLNGRNLMHARRAEISASALQGVWVDRQLVLQLTYRR